MTISSHNVFETVVVYVNGFTEVHTRCDIACFKIVSHSVCESDRDQVMTIARDVNGDGGVIASSDERNTGALTAEFDFATGDGELAFINEGHSGVVVN